MVSQNIVKMNGKWRKRLLEALSYVFIQLCKRNDRVSQSGERSHCGFNIIGIFPMKIKTYLIRIADYTNCSNESLIFSLIFIDKLIAKNPKFMVTSQNVDYLVLTSIVIAVKFYDDQFYKNSFYAQVGGVSCKSLMRLEMLFLQEIEFELFVEKSLYTKYCQSLKRAVLNKPSKPKLVTKNSQAAGHIKTCGSKLASNNLSYTEIESRYSQCAKPVNMPFSPRPRSCNIHHQKEKSEKKSARYQPNLTGHCYGMKLSNWQVSYRPMICVNEPDVMHCE